MSFDEISVADIIGMQGSDGEVEDEADTMGERFLYIMAVTKYKRIKSGQIP
jgi:hypothetical protein